MIQISYLADKDLKIMVTNVLNKEKEGQHRHNVGGFHHRIKIHEKESDISSRTKQYNI